MNKPTKIITHHAVSATKHTADDVSQWHLARWSGYAKSRRTEAPYAGYTYVIEWDGKTVQCRDHDEEGIHCKGQNFSSIGVCFMGNNDVHYPSDAQKDAWRSLYAKLVGEYGNIPVYPHRKYANKSCHGKLLSDTYYTDILLVETPRMKRLTALLFKLEQMVSQVKALISQERMRG